MDKRQKVDILALEMDKLAHVGREKGCGTGFALYKVKRNYAKYANNVHYAQTQDTQTT